MSLPSSVQAVLDQHNDLVAQYQSAVDFENSQIEIAGQTLNAGDLSQAWAHYQQGQGAQATIDKLTPQIQSLEAQLPQLVTTYGDQYAPGVQLFSSATSVDPSSLRNVTAASNSSAPSYASMGVFFALTVAYFYFSRRHA